VFLFDITAIRCAASAIDEIQKNVLIYIIKIS